MEGRVLPGEGVLGVGGARGADFVEAGDAVAWLELEDVGADGFDDAGHVFTFVGRGVAEVRHLPVFGVGARDDHLDEELVVVGDGDGGVHDLDFGSWDELVVCFPGDREGGLPGPTRASFMVAMLLLRRLRRGRFSLGRIAHEDK